MLLIVGGAAVIVLLYGSTIWERLGSGGELPPFFQWDETENSGEKKDFKSWRTNGKDGLKLNIINAMTSDWDIYLQQAVMDWNKAPSLLLTVSQADKPDPACSYIIGKLKACNDNYGATNWSGLNEAWLDSRGTITASTAKMNEHYLKEKSYAEKLYVVCHELGHGYGLPHRDTNPGNIDLGTCLDYTTQYKNNMQPDEVDFMNLESLYGTINKKRNLGGDETDSTSATSSSLRSFHQKKNNGNRSKISSTGVRHNHSYLNGRLLFKSEYKEIYEEKLPDGGKIISTVLLAR